MKLTDWPALANQNTPIVAVEYHTPDRMQILQQFYHWGEEQSLSVFVWNPGYCGLQQLIQHQGQYILQSIDRGKDGDIIQYLLEEYQPGIYLLEGVLNQDDGSKIVQQLRRSLPFVQQRPVIQHFEDNLSTLASSLPLRGAWF